MASRDPGFGDLLRPDPSVALAPPAIDPIIPGPAHRAQFVVELIGPRSVPAAQIAPLIQPQWYEALGRPELYCMSPADTCWQPLNPRIDGSYDSVAAAWDVLSPRGTLSSGSASQLLQSCEQFARAVNRRAMGLPEPGDIDRVAKALLQVRDQLDVGVSIAIFPTAGRIPERDLWIACAALGLQFSPDGAFVWKSPQHPNPLFSATPIGDAEAFSLGAVQAGTDHEGVTIGFNVPLCPNPMAAFDGAVRAAEYIARQIGGAAFDDSARPLSAKVRDALRRDLAGGVVMLEKATLRPGSASAIKVFGAS
jgi:hypothetical protein